MGTTQSLEGLELPPGASTQIYAIAVLTGSLTIAKAWMMAIESTCVQSKASIPEGWSHVYREFRHSDHPDECYHEPLANTRSSCTCYSSTRLSSLTLVRGYEIGDVYEYYSVLLLAWEDISAYRRGLGRIAKVVWERETLGWVDMTIG